MAYIKSLEEKINRKDEIILTIQEELLKLKTEVHGSKKDNGRSHHRRPRQRSPTPEHRTRHCPHAPERVPERWQELVCGQDHAYEAERQCKGKGHVIEVVQPEKRVPVHSRLGN